MFGRPSILCVFISLLGQFERVPWIMQTNKCPKWFALVRNRWFPTSGATLKPYAAIHSIIITYLIRYPIHSQCLFILTSINRTLFRIVLSYSYQALASYLRPLEMQYLVVERNRIRSHFFSLYAFSIVRKRRSNGQSKKIKSKICERSV